MRILTENNMDKEHQKLIKHERFSFIDLKDESGNNIYYF